MDVDKKSKYSESSLIQKMMRHHDIYIYVDVTESCNKNLVLYSETITYGKCMQIKATIVIIDQIQLKMLK